MLRRAHLTPSTTRGAELPAFVAPMLARPGVLPRDARWALEVKWDGMRAQVRVSAGRCRFARATGATGSAAFAELAPLADRVRDQPVLAGVITGPGKRPSRPTAGAVGALRHTRATELLCVGASVTDVRDCPGHASTKTTFTDLHFGPSAGRRRCWARERGRLTLDHGGHVAACRAFAVASTSWRGLRVRAARRRSAFLARARRGVRRWGSRTG